MPQIFFRGSNTIARVTLIGGPLLSALVIWVCLVYARSSYGTGAGEVRVQAVPFSHEHHVGVLGIDCRYCHGAVERSSYAGMPPTKTCMNCHSQIWVGSKMLEPVRAVIATTNRSNGSASTICPASFISITVFTSIKAWAARPAMVGSMRCR